MDDFVKLWLPDSLNRVAITRALQAIENLGQALPCRVVAVSGAILTVAFETTTGLPQVTIPKAESPWIRMPTQVGDLGFTVPATASLGAISGLGSGVATDVQPGNLSALVFVPVSSQAKPPANPDMAYVQGPGGAVVQTTTGTPSSVAVGASGTTITYGSTTVAVEASQVAIQGATNITGNTYVTGTLEASTGASGTFTSADGKTITVVSGIITQIV